MAGNSITRLVMLLCLCLSPIALTQCATSAGKAESDACGPVASFPAPAKSLLLRVGQDGGLYVLDRTAKSVTDYDQSGKTLAVVHLPNEYQPNDIPDFGVWNGIFILPYENGAMIANGSAASNVNLGSNARLRACASDADRYFEITPTGMLIACLQGTTTNASAYKLLLPSDISPSLFHASRVPRNDYGIDWQSLVSGFDGYVYIQEGKIVEKFDDAGRSLATIAVSESLSGVLIGVDKSGRLYFEDGLDPQKPMLHIIDSSGVLLHSQTRPFISQQMPLARGLITPTGGYAWLSDQGTAAQVQLMLCKR